MPPSIAHTPFPATDAQAVVVSIVSHGHGACVQGLLQQLAHYSAERVRRVVLTLNIPEAEPVAPPQGWPFALELLRNSRPRGFGANHNLALKGATEPWLCVLNPDVQLLGSDPFAALVRAGAGAGVGCAYPVQVDAQRQLQDSERALPTPGALLRRRLLGRTERRRDWVNAACLLLPRAAWEQLGGFDERYFMYCEDVDLCLRLRLLGLALVRADAKVLHTGARASRRQWRHLRWHVRSLLRLWRSPVYRQARQLLQTDTGPTGSIGSP